MIIIVDNLVEILHDNSTSNERIFEGRKITTTVEGALAPCIDLTSPWALLP